MSETHYYNVRRPVDADKTWEESFKVLCSGLQINYERRHKKGVVSFDISCTKEDYESLMKLLEEFNER